ncbi:hypothetical protein Acr_11g0017540 [Actinidia rufa]|uniref:NAC domain-containing protein n=1 Tax=Actinidia rufa TaxID=165716 RepID=A0A7J0FFJ0_9ERIC|nr:hypothetical protein Acr_11g0017540 [Actinidia rufa]
MGREWGQPILLLHPIEEEGCETIAVGNGTWRSQYSRVINDGESNTIGIKRSFEYMNSGSVQHKKWIMMEFSLAGVLLEQPRSNQKMENDTLAMPPSGNSSYAVIKSEPIVGEQVGLIHGEAGVKTLEQIMRDFPAPELSMENVENVETLEQIIMPPLMQAEPAPIVDKEGGYASGENQVRMQPSIVLHSSNAEFEASAPEVTEAESDVRILDQPCMPAPESLSADSFGHATWNSVISLATPAPTVEPSIVQDPFLNKYPEGTAAENDVEILEQPCIPTLESLPADSHVHAVLNSIISLATPAPTGEPSLTGEPSYEVGYNRIWVESFAEDLLSVQYDLPLEENDQEVGELLEFHNPTYDWLFR